jgi:hypothetical protein
MCGRMGGTHHITAARKSDVCCLKKFLAGTNKHYCSNTITLLRPSRD